MFIFAVPPDVIYFLSAVITTWCLVTLWLVWVFLRYQKKEYTKLVQIILFEEDEKKPEKPSNLIVLHSDETGY